MKFQGHLPPNDKGQVASAQLPNGTEIGLVPQLFNVALRRGDDSSWWDSW